MNHDLQRKADSIKFQNKEDKYKYKIAKRTLDCLISCADEDGDTFAGFEFIASRLCCCVQTVYNHFLILESLSILNTKKIGNKMVKTISFSSSEPSNYTSNYTSSEPSSEPSSSVEANISNIREDKIRGKKNATLRSTKNNDFDIWFDRVWDIFRTYIQQYRTQYGNKQKTKTKIAKAFSIIKKLKGEDELAYKIIQEYIKFKSNEQYTTNLEKIDIDELVEYANDYNDEE